MGLTRMSTAPKRDKSYWFVARRKLPNIGAKSVVND